jgi:YHS domain-containing protein
VICEILLIKGKMKKLHLIIALPLFVFALVFVSGNISTAEINSAADVNSTNADSTQVCIVSGEEFLSSQGVKYQYLNKEVSFCCDGCVKAFKKEPAGYMKDGLRCPVCDDDDGKKDLSHVHDGVKYYFCGSGCKNKFEADAQKYLDNYKK